MSIPWDDPYAARPPWLPDVGEPIDPETAERIMAHYGPEIAAALKRIAAIVRARHHAASVTVRAWTAAEIVTHWSTALDEVLVGYVVLDDRDRGKSFRSVLISIDKGSGALVVQDASGLLTD